MPVKKASLQYTAYLTGWYAYKDQQLIKHINRNRKGKV